MLQAFQSLYAMLRVIMGATDIPNMHDETTQAKTWWQWIIDSIVWCVLWSPSVTFTLGVMCALIVMATVRLIISIFQRDREGSTIINNTFEVKIFCKGMDVCEWLKGLDEYLAKKKIKDDEVKATLLLNKMDTPIKKMLKNYMNPKKKNNYEVISKFLKDSQKKPEASSAVYRHQFDARQQQSNENLHEFHIALLDLGGKAFPELEQKTLDKYVREQFVQGVSNKSLRERLVTDHHEITDPSELLDKATDLERLLQSVNMGERRSTSNNEYTTQQNNRQPHETNQYNRIIRCYNCNKEGHMGRDCRAAYQNNNNNNMHQQTNTPTPPQTRNTPNTSQQTMTLNVRERTSSLRELTGICLINNQKVNYMLDTGSSVSIINKDVIESFKDPTIKNTIKPCTVDVITANGESANIIGELECE